MFGWIFDGDDDTRDLTREEQQYIDEVASFFEEEFEEATEAIESTSYHVEYACGNVMVFSGHQDPQGTCPDCGERMHSSKAGWP